MAVPYEFPFVQSAIGPRLRIVGDEQDTRENSFKAVNDACLQIATTKDSHWGLLKKTGGANAFGYAADIWLYDLGNGTAQVVDVVSNSEGAAPPEGGPRGTPAAAWGEADIRNISEWAPAISPPYEGTPAPGPTPPPENDYQQQLDALHDRLEAVEGRVDTLETAYTLLEERVTVIEGTLTGGFHAHGPVDLPMVVESLTRMRAKGDIDVEVKPGHAVPPTPSDASVDLIDIVVLRRLLDRNETPS